MKGAPMRIGRHPHQDKPAIPPPTPETARAAEQVAYHARHYIETALCWQPAEDGRGHNGLTLYETADLMTKRFCDVLADITKANSQ